jgi:hypothetical protein
MIDLFKKFVALDWQYKRLAVAAGVEMLYVQLFINPLAKQWLTGPNDHPSVLAVRSDEVHLPLALNVARVVNAVAALPLLRASCLVRSVCLCRCLRRRGIVCRLVVGVARDETQPLAAHAWVECDQRPVNDSADVSVRFSPLPTRSGQPANSLRFE